MMCWDSKLSRRTPTVVCCGLPKRWRWQEQCATISFSFCRKSRMLDRFSFQSRFVRDVYPADLQKKIICVQILSCVHCLLKMPSARCSVWAKSHVMSDLPRLLVPPLPALTPGLPVWSPDLPVFPGRYRRLLWTSSPTCCPSFWLPGKKQVYWCVHSWRRDSSSDNNRTTTTISVEREREREGKQKERKQERKDRERQKRDNKKIDTQRNPQTANSEAESLKNDQSHYLPAQPFGLLSAFFFSLCPKLCFHTGLRNVFVQVTDIHANSGAAIVIFDVDLIRSCIPETKLLSDVSEKQCAPEFWTTAKNPIPQLFWCCSLVQLKDLKLIEVWPSQFDYLFVIIVFWFTQWWIQVAGTGGRRFSKSWGEKDTQWSMMVLTVAWAAQAILSNFRFQKKKISKFFFIQNFFPPPKKFSHFQFLMHF